MRGSWRFNPVGGEPFRRGARWASERRRAVDHHKEQPEPHLPSGDEEIAKRGEKNRKEMDEVPAPGTDPLHEGP